MPPEVTLLVWAASVGLMCWMVRTLIKHVEDCQSAAAHSHILAVLERERCEAIRNECRDLRSDCHVAATVAHEAMEEAEEMVESIEPFKDEDEPERW